MAQYSNEKRANLIGAAVAHLAQNVYTKAKVLAPRKEYLSSFLEGMTGVAHRSKFQSFKDGVKHSTISPELGAISDKFSTLGTAVKNKISETNAVVTKRDWVKARQTLRSLKTESPEQIHSRVKDLPRFLDNVDLPIGVSEKQLKSDKGLSAISELKNNKLVSTMHSLSRKLPKQQLTTSLETNKKVELGGKVLGLGATTAIDPLAGLMNAKKMFMASETAKNNKVISGVHHKVVDALLTKPVQKSYNTGKHMNAATGMLISPTVESAQRAAAALGNLTR